MKPIEKKLLALFGDLSTAEREMLLSYAEFLHARRAGVGAPVSLEIVPIDRPAQESVVGAIKRLRASYHMLDAPKLLDEVSALMTQHVMQGRAAVDVIDELERLFRRHHQTLIDGGRSL